MEKEEKKELLGAKEQSNIMKKIYDLLKQKEDDIELCFEANNIEGASVGLYSETGAVYLKKNILGGFKALVPFILRYKATPKTDKARLAMMDYLNNLSEWLVSQERPELSGERTVELIEQTELTYLEFVNDDGSITYSAKFELKYRKDW